MTPAFQALLDRCLALPGVAAYGLRGPDRSFQHRANTDWFHAEQLQKLVSQLAQALEGLRGREIDVSHACWVFEHARLFIAQRDDGTVLVLFAENRPSLQLADCQQALADFLRL